MITTPYPYCDRSDIERRLSAWGVELRLDDDGDGVLDDEEQEALDQSITDGSETVNFYSWMKYDPAVLVGNAWVNHVASYLAAYSLCLRRGNPPPESFLTECEKLEGRLQMILDGGALIPFAPLRRRMAPLWSNSRLDVRYTWRCIRIDFQTSAPRQSALSNQTDWASLHNWEI